MIFKYSQKNRNGKVYTFKDLDEGETFMLSDPRKDTVIFEECGIYMVVEDKEHAIDLDNGRLIFIDKPATMVVYPVICECSVTLYPDVR